MNSPYNRSRSSSIDSYHHTKDERVDPEGNVDDIGEFASILKKQNEERRRKELEKRQAYNSSSGYVPTLARTPPPVHSTLPANRRSQSIGNLRSSERRQAYGDNLDNTPKPLAYSKSASQSRTSVRSLKRRAPPPPGPPVPATYASHTQPTRNMRSASSTPSIPRVRSRQGSQAPGVHSTPPASFYARPGQRDNAYATPYGAPSAPTHYAMSPTTPRTSASTPLFSDIDPGAQSDDNMQILRPPSTNKPAVAPKPRLTPGTTKYSAAPRHPPAKPTRNHGNITPSELEDIRRQEFGDSD